MIISCEGCKWWHEFSGVCCNPDSEYRADFVDEGCGMWEGMEVE